MTSRIISIVVVTRTTSCRHIHPKPILMRILYIYSISVNWHRVTCSDVEGIQLSYNVLQRLEILAYLQRDFR
ncbi:hypothetical protein P168DRAFT_79756 [Aspergillus campestris IBT 28561]|uniref:Uncharacterized protein n=1 Tax=Aspergillus campestris (strain IBT 28561) TaxID=1392248 RepID=A0A2I1CR79_ASPC2|nr:uncharacterized protein P168DRAFT_79756 [Aspergillus campestris IBT 28561]PKY00119.1 hypothetical protein P168DRAFT_79756 [Aspergillus campestris IBT 28561]